MVKHTSKILQCSHRRIFIACFPIFPNFSQKDENQFYANVEINNQGKHPAHLQVPAVTVVHVITNLTCPKCQRFAKKSIDNFFYFVITVNYKEVKIKFSKVVKTNNT